jgi:hypothetical protein
MKTMVATTIEKAVRHALQEMDRETIKRIMKEKYKSFMRDKPMGVLCNLDYTMVSRTNK